MPTSVCAAGTPCRRRLVPLHPSPRHPRSDDDVLHWSKPAVAVFDRGRAVDLHRDRIHRIDGGETVDDERNHAASSRHVLVLTRSGEVLVAPDQDVVSIELKADDDGVWLPRRGYSGEPGETL